MLKSLLAGLGLALSLGAQALAQPAAAPPPNVQIAPAQCQALAGDHGDIVDAQTEVISAKPIAAVGDIPAYCQVVGYIAPHQAFELVLPMTWQGRYVQVGCGGMCGAPIPWLCDDSIRRGYACMAPDLGHGSGGDSKWARNNLQGMVDFGYRGVHVAALAGKALTRKAYGQPARWSYFIGGSTGGRLAMSEVQRFPWDFNGVVSGVPIMNFTGDQVALMWGGLAFRNKDGGPLLTLEEIKRVHAAVLAKCDMNDGVKDGFIGDPRACAFDPGVLTCKAGATADCLSDAQVAGLRKMYRGPVDSSGAQIYGGLSVGSELEWTNGYLDGGRYTQSIDRYRNMAFFSPAPADWKPEDFNWDEDYKRLPMTEQLYGANNPDVRRFKAVGGKLIQFQGWNDEAVLPLNTIDYYEMVTRLMGGPQATQSFYRLFAIPGMNHAGSNRAAGSIDYMSAIQAWVERGEAPDVLVGAYLKGGPGVLETVADIRAGKAGTLRVIGSGHVVSTDLAKDAEFTRPIYPYPLLTRYKGRGDPNSAASFKAVNP